MDSRYSRDRSGMAWDGPNCDVKMVISASEETHISVALSRAVKGMFLAITTELFVRIFFEEGFDDKFI